MRLMTSSSSHLLTLSHYPNPFSYTLSSSHDSCFIVLFLLTHTPVIDTRGHTPSLVHSAPLAHTSHPANCPYLSILPAYHHFLLVSTPLVHTPLCHHSSKYLVPPIRHNPALTYAFLSHVPATILFLPSFIVLLLPGIDTA